MVTLSEEQLNIMLNEYNIFINQRNKQIKELKRLIHEVENMELPSLFNILSEQFGIDKNPEWKCETCEFYGKNKASLSSHVKVHLKENK